MRIRIFRHGVVDIPLPVRVAENEWRGETSSRKDVNKTIEEYRNIAEDIIARYEYVEKYMPSIEEIKRIFYDEIGKKPLFKPINLRVNTLLDRFINERSKSRNWTKQTILKFRQVKHHLAHYNCNLVINEITKEMAQDYVDFLQRIYQFKNTTMLKHWRFITWFLRWAHDEGFYDGNAYITYKPKLNGTRIDGSQILYLTVEEIKRLEEFYFKDEGVARARDVFVFCCFTGLRFSDAHNLRKDNIVGDYLNIVTKKTSDALKIELNNHSKKILDKYKDVRFPDNLALPVVSNTQMNLHLKTMARLAGIDTPIRRVYFRGAERIEETFPKWQLITSHCARRSFVVMALQLGIPIEVVMKWTGHCNYESIKPYVAIVDDLRQRSMAKFDTI